VPTAQGEREHNEGPAGHRYAPLPPNHRTAMRSDPFYPVKGDVASTIVRRLNVTSSTASLGSTVALAHCPAVAQVSYFAR
jgi:hypothetical protein